MSFYFLYSTGIKIGNCLSVNIQSLLANTEASYICMVYMCSLFLETETQCFKLSNIGTCYIVILTYRNCIELHVHVYMY